MRDLLLALALSPILIPQGLWTGLRAARLPEAAGHRVGKMGAGRTLRVLITGDSSAAGVGVDQQALALGGQIAHQLSDSFEIHWQVVAKSGGTAASTLALIKASPPATCDIAVVALGVNDAKNGVSATAWARNYAALIDHLQTQCGAKHIYLSAVPDLSHFPLLPWPLRAVLGRRAVLLERALQQMAAQTVDLHHVSMRTAPPKDAIASDGFHPGALAYAQWGRVMAAHILADHPLKSEKEATL